MEEKRRRSNIFELVEHRQPEIEHEFHADPELAAKKLVENRFRATGLTAVESEVRVGGAWEVLLKGTMGIYGEEAIYYRVTYSSRTHHVIIEKFRCASRVRLEEAHAETILEREN